MKEFFSNPGVIALIGTLFGGAGLEIIRRWMDRNQRKSDEASKFRDELRKEIESLRTQLNNAETKENQLEAEIDRWKGLYYEEKEEYLKSITALQILTERLRVADLHLEVDKPAGE